MTAKTTLTHTNPAVTNASSADTNASSADKDQAASNTKADGLESEDGLDSIVGQ